MRDGRTLGVALALTTADVLHKPAEAAEPSTAWHVCDRVIPPDDGHEEPPGPVAGGAAVPAGGPGRGAHPGRRRTEAAPAETLTGDAAQAGEEARPVPGYEVSSPRRSLPACWGSNQASSQATKRTLSKSRRARFFRLP